MGCLAQNMSTRGRAEVGQRTYNERMIETKTYDDPSVLPGDVRSRWRFAEVGSAAALLAAVCPQEWADIVDVLRSYALDPPTWMKKGGNRGEVAKQLDAMFHARGWRELRLDLVTYGLLRDKDDRLYRRLHRVVQEGYLVDNVKGAVALDIEWNAKDGNLDRDFGAYRAWHAAGALTAAVLITQDKASLKPLAERLWAEYQKTLPTDQRTDKLPIDIYTSTTTNFEKALMRIRRGSLGACPLLLVAACEQTWNGRPYAPLKDGAA